jgi:Domain of unknown function (DUF4149)
MNSIPDRRLEQVNWSIIVMFVLAFWLSSSVLLDFVIMPSLFSTGMMTQIGFVSAGYSIFSIFNRIELLCAALVLTGSLVFIRYHKLTLAQERWSTVLSGTLLAIALIYTYILTPQMSALGLQLDLFQIPSTMPSAMLLMHQGYWILEIIKLAIGTILLRWCYKNSCTLA